MHRNRKYFQFNNAHDCITRILSSSLSPLTALPEILWYRIEMEMRSITERASSSVWAKKQVACLGQSDHSRSLSILKSLKIYILKKEENMYSPGFK